MRFKIEKVYKTTSSHFFLIIALHDYVLLYILRAIVKNSVGRNSIERERSRECLVVVQVTTTPS